MSEITKAIAIACDGNNAEYGELLDAARTLAAEINRRIEQEIHAEPWVEGQLIAADFNDPLCEDGKYVLLTIRVPAREVAAGPVDVRFRDNSEPPATKGEA